ncbi:hypothetical protein DASC09_053730 [Saccharomycopsis crataegensis]|uniref:phosphoinositide 5-phosphatase n=1 Tax=Saccharomycopsis crataegensis TaxID=43959 RepID=A0AAV5QT87_9ASCO|nr:hypothetical protein DASC09_053730 [Saccharomycopsis crataegensis]
MKILLNQTPRSIAIVSNKRALLIQDPFYRSQNTASHHNSKQTKSTDPNSSKRCVVEFVDSWKLDRKKYIELSSVYDIDCLGVLGLISINDYSFLIIITKALEVGSPRPNEKIFQIQDVEFICLNSTDFDSIFSHTKYQVTDPTSHDSSHHGGHKRDDDDQYTYPFNVMKKSLLKGNFYFANSFDLTNSLQNRDTSRSVYHHSLFNFNKKFLWNSLFIEELTQFRDRLGNTERKIFDECRFLGIIIRGFVQTLNSTINLEKRESDRKSSVIQQESLITLISKIGHDRSGKIFGVNGLDDEGNVANYIESEVIFYNEHYCISYAIIRGNVPIYYEIDNQQSSSLLKKIQINRPFDATQQAFRKHFDSLIKSFGEIHLVNEITSSIAIEDIERKPANNGNNNHNLLSNHKKGRNGIEFDIFNNYYEHFQKLVENPNYRDLLKMNNFNFSLSNLQRNQVSISQIIYAVEDSIFRFAALCYDNINKNHVNKQSGVFRVCSFDMADKCNELQKIISKQVLLAALRDTYSYVIDVDKSTGALVYDTFFSKLNEDLWTKLGYLWNGNNNIINRILSKYNTELKQVNKKGNIINNNFDLSNEYLSEPVFDDDSISHSPENGSLLVPPAQGKKRTSFLNSFTDMTLSTSKKLFNLSNYKDWLNDLEKRNNIISVFLGKEQIDYHGNVIRKITLYDPINDYVNNELKKLSDSYLSEKQISIFTGTFNVNGTCYEGDLSSWLFPEADYKLSNDDVAEDFDTSKQIHYDKMPDMFYIGLQEIVELTPGQIMNVDSTNRNFWERKILFELNNKIDNTNGNKGQDKYILLWSGHLGGLLAVLYIKNSQTAFIKRIEESMKKTGLGGMAANKGGIAVSVQYSDTTFCFVTSHLAAGLNNVEERHQNFKSLNTGLRFSGNKTIRSHDIIIWLGDFNYRIGSTNEDVRSRISRRKYGELFELDQLNQQMQSGDAFPYYQEFEIKFKPTYKFNKNEDTYDISEKMRIPAWCDRILSQSKQLKQLTYGACFDIMFSDHRPVFGSFLAKAIIINETLKNKLSGELYANRKRKFGDIDSFILSNNLSDLMRKANFNNESITELQQPSSDKDKWWFSNGLLAKVELFENIRNVKEFDEKSEADRDELLQSFINLNGEFKYEPGMYINPNRPANPFEFTDEPDFIYP